MCWQEMAAAEDATESVQTGIMQVQQSIEKLEEQLEKLSRDIEAETLEWKAANTPEVRHFLERRVEVKEQEKAQLLQQKAQLLQQKAQTEAHLARMREMELQHQLNSTHGVYQAH